MSNLECKFCGKLGLPLKRTSDDKYLLCNGDEVGCFQNYEAPKPRMWLPFVEALYMYQTFGVVSYHADNPPQKTEIQDVIPYYNYDCDMGEILEAFKDIKFYIKDEWLPFFEPTDGDINKLFEVITREILEKEVDDIKEAIYRREIIMRNWQQFFMPSISITE